MICVRNKTAEEKILFLLNSIHREEFTYQALLDNRINKNKNI